MKIHLIAIGGSIMHNLAIALQEQGHIITGSDDEIYEPALSRLKNKELLPYSIGWKRENITPDIDLIILGMHAKADNPELIRAQELQIQIMSFPEFIYNQSKNKKRIVVAGSHGKTSVTSMLMHILKSQSIDFDYAVGSKVEGFDNSIKLTNSDNIIIIEGDEYLSSTIDKRPKFLWYQPDILLINGIEWDHINVFPTYSLYLEQFELLIKSCGHTSLIVSNSFDEEVRSFVEKIPSEANKKDSIQIEYIIKDKQFIIQHQNQLYPILLFGKHNIANISGAITICKEIGIDYDTSLNSLGNFKGAALRLETIFKDNNLTVYRDFAHAPSKTKATVEAVKEKHPKEKIIAIQELNTFSSLNPDYIIGYKNTLAPIDNAFVFVNPEVQKMKLEYPLSEPFLQASFNRQDLTYLSSNEELNKLLISIKEQEEGVLLLMSSGKLGGIDIKSIFT